MVILYHRCLISNKFPGTCQKAFDDLHQEDDSIYIIIYIEVWDVGCMQIVQIYFWQRKSPLWQLEADLD